EQRLHDPGTHRVDGDQVRHRGAVVHAPQVRQPHVPAAVPRRLDPRRARVPGVPHRHAAVGHEHDGREAVASGASGRDDLIMLFGAGDPAKLWAFRPHPEIWVLVVGIAALWVYAIRWIGPKATLPGETIVTRSQIWWGVGGILTLWLASDWPVHDIGEQYLYSVHMFQHIVFQFVVAPMLLLATPTWLARMIVGNGRA